MREGDVALAALPHATGGVKHRPVVVLRAMPPHGDLLVCGVSTQLWHEVDGFDDVVGPGGEDYDTSGLKARSLIRLGFLAVLPATDLRGPIGAIGQARHERLLARLSRHLRSARPEPPPTS